jgi:asparagine synthase (glutamine-hydrolysing)
MCGLVGYVNFKEPITSSHIIEEMLLLQKHRGPDDSGTVFIDTQANVIVETLNEDPSVGNQFDVVFGFNRLSILDLSSNGHQPMINSKRDVVMMMNGEVYNAIDYRQDLIDKGYVFKSTTDTEIVLYLYLEYGVEKMASLLNGMFAIVLYDYNLKKIFLFRDRFGIKPLYLIKNDDFIAFSSEIKSFKALPNFTFQLDKDHLDEYLLFRNCINKTLVKGIQNIEQGTIYDYDFNSSEWSNKPYYDTSKIPSIIDSTISAKSLETDLQKAIKYQLISDVKVGTQLSGGIDSSLVTHYSKLISNDAFLETFSVVFDNPKFTEEHYIDYVANFESVKSHKFTMHSNYYLDTIYKATWHFEHPINHPNTIGLYLLSEGAKKHVTVLLSGEGADETFCGYGYYKSVNDNPFFSLSFLYKLKANVRSLFSFFSYYLTQNGRIMMSSSFGNIYLTKKIYKNFDFQKATHQRRNIINNIQGEGISKQRKFDFKSYLPDLLMRQDKMSMAHSIENRVPFLDNDLVEKAFMVPDDLLLRKTDSNQETKFILKKISENVFGNSFSFRKKQGFSIPLKEFFLSDEFKKLWIETIFPGLKKRGIFNDVELAKWYNTMANLSNRKVETFWISISFEIWAQQYLDIEDENSHSI